MSIFQILGTIISHAYLVAGFLPERLAFPCWAASLLGPESSFDSNIKVLMVQAARYSFLVKPVAAISQLNKGVPCRMPSSFLEFNDCGKALSFV